MLEFAHRGPAELRMAFGGDTLNTAVYLARLTRDLPVTVDYVTALGDDAYSDAMLASWREEGIATDLVARLPGRLPGLYTIRTDARGERSFTYWRSQAAARDMLKEGRDRLLGQALEGADLLYISGITLSIFDEPQREALLTLMDGVREAGGKAAFDGNFRPAGWPDGAEARAWFCRALERTDIALPTFDDERALFGDADPSATAARLHQQGVPEVVVKLGGDGCLLSHAGASASIPASPVSAVVDSTAAGDSFNAGYLTGRLLGKAPDEAARLGHRLAGRVVCHQGAVIPNDAMTDLRVSVSA